MATEMSISKREALRVMALSDSPDRLCEMLYEAWDALAFYADEKTWDALSDHGTVTTATPARRDGGERARQALERAVSA